MLAKLVEKREEAEDDETIELFKMDWYIAPVLNPDGYAFTKSKLNDIEHRFWRKNRQVVNS